MSAFATDPDSVKTPMSDEELAHGFDCDTFNLGQLNYALWNFQEQLNAREELNPDELAAALCESPVFQACVARLTAPSTHTVKRAFVNPIAGEEGQEFCWTVEVDKPVTVEPLYIPMEFEGWKVSESVGGPFITKKTLIIAVGDTQGTACVYSDNNEEVEPNGQITASFGEIERIPGRINDVSAIVTNDDVLQIDYIYYNHDSGSNEGNPINWHFWLNSPAPADMTLDVVWSGSEHDLFPKTQKVFFAEGEVAATVQVATGMDDSSNANRQLCAEIHDQMASSYPVKGYGSPDYTKGCATIQNDNFDYAVTANSVDEGQQIALNVATLYANMPISFKLGGTYAAHHGITDQVITAVAPQNGNVTLSVDTAHDANHYGDLTLEFIPVRTENHIPSASKGATATVRNIDVAGNPPTTDDGPFTDTGEVGTPIGGGFNECLITFVPDDSPFGSGSGTVQTNVVEAFAPSHPEGDTTYAWTRVSGDSSIVIDDAASNSVSWSRAVTAGETYTAVWRVQADYGSPGSPQGSYVCDVTVTIAGASNSVVSGSNTLQGVGCEAYGQGGGDGEYSVNFNAAGKIIEGASNDSQPNLRVSTWAGSAVDASRFEVAQTSGNAASGKSLNTWYDLANGTSFVWYSGTSRFVSGTFAIRAKSDPSTTLATWDIPYPQHVRGENVECQI